MRRYVAGMLLMALALPVGGTPAWASAQAEIQAATGEGKAVFCVVTQRGDRQFERARAIALEAHARRPETAVVVLDRGVPENQALVQHYRLQYAPVPLILVVAPNGVVAGGALLKDLTAETLIQLIPSPKKAVVLLHRSQKTPVIVVACHERMPQRSAVFEACNAAIARLEGKATTVVIDMEKEKEVEKAYLEELRVNPREAVPTTIVFNDKGQKTAVFRRMVTAEELHKACLMKAPCCPDGNC